MYLTKLAFIVEYDGSRYHGFQLQPLSPTVQEVLEEAVFQFTGERLRVDCASRTDAGVHAKGQVVSLRTTVEREPRAWLRGLNHFLPEDVALQAVYALPDGFNVRTRATGRRYQFMILNRSVPSSLLRQRTHWEPRPLDVDAMNRAAETLLGERDFSPFCSQLLKKGAGTVRRLWKAEFRRDEDLICFEVEGNSFLPQQVRRMAGSLIDVGLGKQSFARFTEIAESKRRGLAGPTLPPQGLTLVKVLYTEFPLGAQTPVGVHTIVGNNERGHENVHPQSQGHQAQLARR